jgi:hypothetical protein
MNSNIAGYPPQTGRTGYVVLRGMKEAIKGENGFPVRDYAAYIIVRGCPFCKKPSRVKVSGEGLWKWEHGALVQNAFPDLDAGQREQVLTGIHPECWDKSFPLEEED